MKKDIWCQGCNQWYTTEEQTSECPYCYTLNYSGVEENLDK